MGSAIECFEGAGAVVVPRSRFAPVKTCADLFALRSDAYTVAEDSTVSLLAAAVRINSSVQRKFPYDHFRTACSRIQDFGVPEYTGRNRMLHDNLDSKAA